MGDMTEVYGCIIGPSLYDQDIWQDIWMAEQNAIRIGQLPETDTRPPLTSDMFHISQPSSLYMAQIIVFGAASTRVEHVWDRWPDKVEILLRSLYCDGARVHLYASRNEPFHNQWEPVAPEDGALAGDTPVRIQN